METDYKVVIVGTGHAGFTAAATLVDGGFIGRITLIGAEPVLPYERPPLSKAYLAVERGIDTLTFRPEPYYSRHRIDLRLGTAVVRIDRDAREVVLADDSRVRYDHLILALGARARALPLPGASAGNVLTLRDASDALRLRSVLTRARSVVVIGAGFIGLEVAAKATDAGAQVTVVEALPRTMSRVASPQAAEFLEVVHRSRGVTFRLGRSVLHLTGDDLHADGVALDSGELVPADLIVVGIGALPVTDVAVTAGLAVRDGIEVDEYLLTSDPAISAVGDCARFPSGSGSTRLESVQNATDQARCVAGRLLGEAKPYSAVAWFWTEQAGHRVQMVGHYEAGVESVLRPGRDADHFSVLHFAGGHLVGAESVNAPADHVSLRRLMAAGCDVTLEQASNPRWDLRQHVSTALAH